MRAVILQPRAQNPAGAALTPARAEALAAVLAPTGAVVVEDDHANDISSEPLVSLGRWLPERTVHVRSFSKSHGPDLRLAAVGGAGDVVAQVANRRLLGPGWSSRILQSVLLELLRDPGTPAVLAAAARAYARRRALVVGRARRPRRRRDRARRDQRLDRRRRRAGGHGGAGHPRHRRRARRPVPGAPDGPAITSG